MGREIALADGNLRLSLHRGGTHPDVTGDRGVHEMTYSLLPHASGFSAEAAVYPAYELNVPIEAYPGLAQIRPLAEISAPNVICEAVKPAEDGSDAYVLRLYECEGARADAFVRFGAPAARAALTNLLEDEKQTLPMEDGGVRLRFRPFEIKTVKVCR